MPSIPLNKWDTSVGNIAQASSKYPEFHFPYTNPYAIQEDLMKHLYDTLSKKNGPRMSILQSPTGTGKTLSIICASLAWLRQAKQLMIEKELNDSSYANESGNSNHGNSHESDEPDWVLEHEATKKRKLVYEEEIQSKRRKIGQMNSLLTSLTGINTEMIPELTVNNLNAHKKDSEDNDLLLEELDYSSAQLIKDLYQDEIEEISHMNTEFKTPKIIFCTRTHSQIAQFVKEFQKTEYINDIKLISLGSRSNLCIHPKVKNITSNQMQSDRCQTLRQNHKCDFYDSKGITLFTETVFNRACDIEEMSRIGRRVVACPYFGSRRAMLEADLILMPYSSLIHERVRKSIGIEKLNDCVIIFDEGHNLEQAFESTHSSPITSKQLNATIQQLNRYMEKYKLRLRRSTLNKVQQIIKILTNCNQYLQNISSSKIVGVNDFLSNTKIEDINLWEIQEFIDKSKLSQKLNGFIDRFKNEELTVNTVGNSSNREELMMNCIHPSLSFLLSLTNVGTDGKLVLEVDEKQFSRSIRFLLLNPSAHLESICREAHAVILAGGTMEPIQHVIQQLFPKSYRNDVSVFECGHIIPKDHLLPICLSHYESEKTLNFTIHKRNDPQMITALGNIIYELCKVAPGGVICFFPSYAYEETVLQYWIKDGIIRKLQSIKAIYREPKKSTEVDQTLQRYKKSIDAPEGNQTGALLSCVIDGKMSEGINFADEYGRLVLIVGLPYPNQYDPSLQEKMKYLDRQFGNKAGSKYYRDVCMNSVNQSIGRCIRHAKDYASIVLLDERYCDNSIQKELPKWIQEKHIQNCHNSSEVVNHLKDFFSKKPKKE